MLQIKHTLFELKNKHHSNNMKDAILIFYNIKKYIHIFMRYQLNTK